MITIHIDYDDWYICLWSMNTLYQLNLVPIHLMQLVISTQKHILQKENYLWIKMFKMNDIMIKKAQGKQQVEQPFVGH